MRRPTTIIRQITLFDAPQFPTGSSELATVTAAEDRVITTTSCSTCRWGEEQGRYCGALTAATSIAEPAGYWIMAGSRGACPSWTASRGKED